MQKIAPKFRSTPRLEILSEGDAKKSEYFTSIFQLLYRLSHSSVATVQTSLISTSDLSKTIQGTGIRVILHQKYDQRKGQMVK